jgi:hypothetical protein
LILIREIQLFWAFGRHIHFTVADVIGCSLVYSVHCAHLYHALLYVDVSSHAEIVLAAAFSILCASTFVVVPYHWALVASDRFTDHVFGIAIGEIDIVFISTSIARAKSVEGMFILHELICKLGTSSSMMLHQMRALHQLLASLAIDGLLIFWRWLKFGLLLVKSAFSSSTSISTIFVLVDEVHHVHFLQVFSSSWANIGSIIINAGIHARIACDGAAAYQLGGHIGALFGAFWVIP